MRKFLFFGIVAGVLLLVSSYAILCMDDTDANGDESFTITDGKGNTFNFSKPADHLITLGYANTLTVAQTGNVQKIIGCDNYSMYDYYKDENLSYLTEANVHNIGSPYTSDTSAFQTFVLQATKDGKFNKDTDAIIITSATSFYNSCYQTLTGYGYKVLFWGTMNDYSTMIDCVDSIATIAGGTNNPVSKEAKEIWDTVTDKVQNNTVDKKFIYLWYDSSKGFGVGNGSSLGGSMLKAAGGTNLEEANSQASGGFYYGGESYYLQIIRDNPDALVFMAYNSSNSFDNLVKMAKLENIPNTIYPMEKDWNNYCINGIRGLNAVYDIFHSFTITDGTGAKFTFEQPAVHLVTLSSASSIIVSEVGAIEKIIGCDKYSMFDYYKDARLAYLTDDHVHNIGSPYTSDVSAFETWILKETQKGNFDIDTDAIVITSGTTFYNALKNSNTDLMGKGYKILFWGTLNDYSELVECVDSIAKLAGGTANPVSAEVNSTYEEILEKTSKITTKKDFIYLWWSDSKGIGVGDNRCLGGSFFTAAGGNNLQPEMDGASSGQYFGGEAYALKLIADNPQATVFVGYNSNMTTKQILEACKLSKMPNQYCGMQKGWNNYTPDSLRGLEIAYNAMYNDVCIIDDSTINNNAATVNLRADKVMLTSDDILAFDKGAVETVNLNYVSGSISLSTDAVKKMLGDGSNYSLSLSTSVGEKQLPAQSDESDQSKLDAATVVSIDYLGGGVKDQLGNVTVTVDYEAPAGKEVAVYYLDGNNLSRVDSSYANGKMTFTTSHFSDFVICEVLGTGSGSGGDSSQGGSSDAAGNNGDSTLIYIVMAIIILIIAISPLSSLRTKKN